MQVFISYKRENQLFAENLREHIINLGHDVWLDVVDIGAGEEWDTEIFRGLKASEVVIGILTPASLASNNVLDEWGYALSTNKRLLLLWLEDVDEADIPPRYIRIQRIDMREDRDYGFERLQTILASSAKVVPTSSYVENTSEPRPIKHSHQNIVNNKSNRYRMLDKVKAFWVDGVLEQSIHGAALIELGLERSQDSVNNPWQTVLQHSAYGDYALPNGTRVYDIYQELQQELLILGDPGAGKTTSLLELARDTITLAKEDDTQPIPVVFNLSSWADERKPLKEWLLDELNTKYQVPRKVAQAWVETDSLLLLLDGLDEVSRQARDLCVDAINEFRKEHGFTPIVVCSRISDYEALSNRLNLNGAIVIQPLNDEQIDHYLASLGDDLQGVRDAMADDPELRNIAQTPLMLSIMTLAFYGLSSEDLPPLDSPEAQRKRLFETYTERMFARREDEHYSPAEGMHYLKWLAGRMVERKQSVFYIENLQIDWIAGDFSRRLFRVVGRTSFGIVMGLAVGFISAVAVMQLNILITSSPLSLNLKDAIVLFLLFLTVPAGLGGLIFGGAGGIAFALDTMPVRLRPIRQLLIAMRDVYLVTVVFSVIASILTVFFLYLIMFIENPSYIEMYRSSSDITGWTAVFVDSMKIMMAFIAVGFLAGSIASLVGLVMNWTGRHRLSLFIINLIAVIQMSVLFIMASVGSYVFNYHILGLTYYSVILDLEVMIPLILATIITVTLAIILMEFVLRFVPSLQSVVPYIMVCAGAVIFGIAYNIIYANFSYYGSSSNNIDFSWFVLFIFAVIGGYLIGRINDQIRSAESLSWRWNWRWSLLGVGGVVLLTAVLGSTQFTRLSNYTPEKEASELETVIYPRETMVAQIQPTLTYLETQIAGELIPVEKADEVKNIIDNKLYTERGAVNNLREEDPEQYDAYLESHLCAAALDLQMGFYNRFMPFGTYISNETSLQELQAEYDAELRNNGLTDEQIQMLFDMEREASFCDYHLSRFETDIGNSRQRYTMDGIQEGIDFVIRLSISLGLSLVVFGGVFGGLRKTEVIDIRIQPNSGIRTTFYTALKVMMLFGGVGLVVGGITGILFGGIRYNGEVILPYGMGTMVAIFSIVGIAIGLSLGFIMGGIDAVIKHVILRGFLMRSGSIPLNYARLLDYLAERILLRKVGGGYIFIHRYLLEYFADLETTSSGKIHFDE